jgi:carboxymethylenebutenolidase
MPSDKIIEIGGVPHYLARAATPATAGVLLLPHVGGVDEFVCEFADELAERGLTSVAWNPYPDLPMGASFTERPKRPTDAAAVRLMSGCIDAMESELGITRVATIGFCMGGRYALLFGAHEPRLRALVACYPSIPVKLNPGQDVEPVTAAASVACPVQVVYPGKDQVTSRPVFERLQTALQARSAETAIQFYPEADHGFMHTEGEHNAAASERARPQIIAFLETYLR